MDADVAAHTVPRFTRTLLIAAVASLFLLLSTVVAATLEISRVQEAMLEAAQRGERSAFIVGDVSEQLARLRFNVASAVDKPQLPADGYADRIAAIRSGLDRAVGDLAETLPDEQRPIWNENRQELERVERRLLDSFTLARAGDHAQAAKILGEDADAITRLYESLDRAAVANESHLLAQLEAARRRAGTVRLAEASVGGLVVLGTMAIWLGVLRVITRQARLLAQYTARVEAANQDLDAFAGRVAHDLKNAIGALALGAHTLALAAGDPKSVQAIAERIERSSRKTSGLIEGLLAFSRAGRPASGVETASVRDVLAGVLEENETLASSLGVVIESTVENDLHASCAPGLLHVVLANLCNNAVKFLAGRGERRVRVSARSDGAWCVLEVDDTGSGIPKESQARIFEPFYRVPGVLAAGTGIGLATVHRIVTAHGGDIAVDSREGKGTRITIRLPIGERLAKIAPRP